MSSSANRPPRVVVGYDASASAKVAVDWAADEAERLGLPLSVVYAADYTGLVGGPVSMSPWVPGVSVDQAKHVTEAGVDRARAQHPALDVHAVTLIGSPGTVLIQESEGAALVVVGTHGRGDATAVLLGSVASRVATHAKSPVVVVRGQMVTSADAGHPVVVGVDGSAAAAGALRAAVSHASVTGAPLRIVCAWVPTTPEGWEYAYWRAVDAEHDPDDTARAAAEQVAADAAATVRDLAPALPVETRVRGGDPASVLVEAAGDAGLVVVGSRGRGSLASLFLGSVSHGVVHGARCPVLVVRAGVGSGAVDGLDAVAVIS
jgi:nucleotide-binding universal stress UspA family protein